MAYIGYNPSQLAIAPFATKYFTGDGTTTTFTLDQSVPGANEANVEVFVENVQQNPVDAYTIGGALNNSLIFSEAPVTGGAIYVIHKGEATYNLQPSTGSVTAATLDPVLRNFTVDNFTGNGSTTTYTLTDTPYSANSILVTVDGIVQTASTNYTVSGTTLSFGSSAPDSGAVITVVHMGFSSGNKAVMDGSITPVKLSTGGPSWETTGRVSITGPSAGSLRLSSSTANAVNKLGRITGRAYDTTQSDFLAFDIRGLSGQNQLWYGGGSDILTCVSEHRWFISSNTTTTSGTQAMLLDINGNLGIGTGGARLNSSGITAGIKSLTLYDAAQGGGGIELMTASTTNTASVGRIIFGTTGNTDGSRAIAWIDSLIQGTTANNQGGLMRFATKADNGSTSTVMQLEANGTLTLPYGQIKFPAAINASSDPNTLDDYEEGTWTPSYSSSGISAVTYGSGRNAYYTKIGRLVTVNINIMTNSVTVTNSSAEVTISGLPFAHANDTECSSSGTIGAAVRWTANPPRNCMITPGQSSVRLFSTGITTAEDETTLRVSDMVASGSGNRNTVRLTITYYV
jgi:hypothetical protein